MPLKLLEFEQRSMINGLPRGQGIVLNGENNQKSTRLSVARGCYTHSFTGPEIALSGDFKSQILRHPEFRDRLSLLAIDEIHLVDKWGQDFRPLYAEIEKIGKRIPCNIPMLGVSATLTAKVRKQVVRKAGISAEYRLMHTSLDRPEIMQIHHFMEHPLASCSDLQFLFHEAKNIEKQLFWWIA
ncbi:hypothetical protein MMC07_004603 [Pseudocyphellaria aurata]|nr:hypothetical protein [Pseudocyphellaria aurata]